MTGPWSLFLATCWLGLAGAVETAPVTVLRVIDGDSIVVAGTVGGIAAGAAVRLRWIDTREGAEAGGDAARAALRDLIAEGSSVRLILDADPAPLDGHGRILALVRCADGRIAQEELIAAGHSAYWRRFGEAAEPWHTRFEAAQQRARAGGAGLWTSLPRWMEAQAAERGPRR